MKKLVSFSIILSAILGLSSFAQSASPTPAVDPAKVTGKLSVAAAANIATVGESLKAAFLAKYPKASLDFVFGASGALTTQIQNGAPFQLFLSADVDFPKKLFDGGLASAAPQVYATGKLILLSTKPLDFKKGLALLGDPAISQFALANPEIAPYGKAAQEALVKAGLWDTVKAKAVIAQTITQALQFTTGATGIGFVNKSALYTKDLAAFADKEGVNWYEVDTSWHAPINHAFVVLKSAAADPTALAFAAFLASPEAKAIFAKAGYAVP
jgi:molybdate transport system substrate-binding protein